MRRIWRYPDGVLLPFFNVPAMTTTATSKTPA
jgi:hypothetical protein